MTNPETQWREAYDLWLRKMGRSDVRGEKAHYFRAGYLAASSKRPEVEEVARYLRRVAATELSDEPGALERDDDATLDAIIKDARALIHGEPKTEEGEG